MLTTAVSSLEPDCYNHLAYCYSFSMMCISCTRLIIINTSLLSTIFNARENNANIILFTVT